MSNILSQSIYLACMVHSTMIDWNHLILLLLTHRPRIEQEGSDNHLVVSLHRLLPGLPLWQWPVQRSRAIRSVCNCVHLKSYNVHNQRIMESHCIIYAWKIIKGLVYHCFFHILQCNISVYRSRWCTVSCVTTVGCSQFTQFLVTINSS